MKSTCLPRPKNPINLETTRLIAIDPGRTNIIFAAEELPDKTIKTCRLTRSQYYRESGILDARKMSESWQRGLKRQLNTMSEASPKGVSLASFKRFLEADLSVANALWKEYFKKRWAQQRFRLYGGKMRVVAKFFNKMVNSNKDNRNLMVAYGASKFRSGGPGEVSVPTSKMYKACKESFETYPVDEFRTTRVHHEDDTILDCVGRRNTDSGRVEAVRGLLWCGSTKQGNSKFVNRDLNGALNIRRCLLLSERPASLDRASCRGQRLSKTIGKMIAI